MSLTEIRTYFPILHWNVLFQKMNDAEIAAFLEELSATVRSYEKGCIIIHAGDLITRMGIVLDGNVTIEMSDIQGNCTILSSVERNGFFGETYALLEHEPLLVDVVASADTTVLFLSVGTTLCFSAIKMVSCLPILFAVLCAILLAVLFPDFPFLFRAHSLILSTSPRRNTASF